MHWLPSYSFNKKQQEMLSAFLDVYGISGLEEALHLYMDQQQEYICRTKTSLAKFRICDIYYLEIHAHTISVHTAHGTYCKYGSLANELKHLYSYGFIKCNQSCIVSLQKIREIQNHDITLTNNESLHMSRHYAPKVIMAFSRYTL